MHMHEAKHAIIVRTMRDLANNHKMAEGELEQRATDKAALDFIHTALEGEFDANQEYMRREAIFEYLNFYNTAKNTQHYGQNNG